MKAFIRRHQPVTGNIDWAWVALWIWCVGFVAALLIGLVTGKLS